MGHTDDYQDWEFSNRVTIGANCYLSLVLPTSFHPQTTQILQNIGLGFLILPSTFSFSSLVLSILYNSIYCPLLAHQLYFFKIFFLVIALGLALKTHLSPLLNSTRLFLGSEVPYNRVFPILPPVTYKICVTDFTYP